MRVGGPAPEPGREGDLESIVVRPLSARQLVAADVAISSIYTLTLLVSATGPGRLPAPGVPTPIVVLLVLVIGLGPALRRPAPLLALVTVAVATVTGGVLGAVHEPFLATAFVLYVAVQRPVRRPRVPLTALVTAAGILLIASPLVGTPEPLPDVVEQLFLGVVVLATAAALGRTVHARRRYAARYAEQLAEHAVLAERLRIAREMHDVVTHSLGVIAVKAAVANHVVARRPEEAHDALKVIEATSRDALAEMRRMLGVLRDDTPVPGLGTLAGLAGRARAAGVEVDLRVHAPDGGDTLPEALGLTVHRVVQEALTNVVTHAPGARCTIRVEVSAEAVEVMVVDDGPGEECSGAESSGAGGHGAGGHGLAGMRERVAGHGGSLSAGPLAGRGFRVRAVIPLAVPPDGTRREDR